MDGLNEGVPYQDYADYRANADGFHEVPRTYSQVKEWMCSKCPVKKKHPGKKCQMSRGCPIEDNSTENRVSMRLDAYYINGKWYPPSLEIPVEKIHEYHDDKNNIHADRHMDFAIGE